MIKKQVKCPRCGKVLLRLYSVQIKSVTCTCGYTIDMKHHKEDDKTNAS
jgi:ribosomal protein L37E